jgi:hypothetical protein
LDRYFIGASGLAASITIHAVVGHFDIQPGIFFHSILFSALSRKIMIVSHDGVDRDILRTFGLAFATGMPTVEFFKKLR